MSMKKRWLIAAAALSAVIAVLFLVFRASEKKEEAAPTPYGPFGLLLIDIDDEESLDRFHVSEKGIYVLDVQQNCEAESAGVVAGDRLLAVNGIEISSTDEFWNRLRTSESPETILHLLHTGEETPFDVVLTFEREPHEEEEHETADRG